VVAAVGTPKPEGLFAPPTFPRADLYEMIPHDARASPYSAAGHPGHQSGAASIDDMPVFFGIVEAIGTWPKAIESVNRSHYKPTAP
jgi:hypothetical protein